MVALPGDPEGVAMRLYEAACRLVDREVAQVAAGRDVLGELRVVDVLGKHDVAWSRALPLDALVADVAGHDPASDADEDEDLGAPVLDHAGRRRLGGHVGSVGATADHEGQL